MPRFCRQGRDSEKPIPSAGLSCCWNSGGENRKTRTLSSANFTRLIVGPKSDAIVGDIEFWFNKDLPWGLKGKRKLSVANGDFTVVLAAQRYLYVALRHEFCELHFLVVYAPHAWSSKTVSQDEATRIAVQFWDTLTEQVLGIKKRAQLILMADANARAGGFQSLLIGDRGSSVDNWSVDEAFARFCCSLDIALPSTLDRFHQGSDITFPSPLRASRIDFVGVHADLCEGVLRSYVLDSVDKLSASPDDHDLVVVELGMTRQSRNKRPKARFDRNKIADTARRLCFIRDVKAMLPPMWCIDPSSHRAALCCKITEALSRHFPCEKRVRGGSKLNLTDEAQGIVDLRKSTLDRLGSLRRNSIWCQRRIVFNAWKQFWTDHTSCSPSIFQQYNSGLAELSIEYAFLRSVIRNTKRPVQRAIREGQSAQLCVVADSALDSTAVKTWDTLKKHFVSGKGAKFAMKPLPGIRDEQGDTVIGHQATADEWLKHHMHIEAGTFVEPQALVDQTVARHVAEHSVATTADGTEGIASHSQFVQVFAKYKSGRSAGNDGVPAEVYAIDPVVFGSLFYSLALKSSLSCCEPVQRKGGHMFSLFKSDDHATKDHWRGILLADTLAKQLRRLQQTNLIKASDAYIGATQFGGVSGKGTDMANHSLRLLQKYAERSRQSLSILFVDCISAFYALIRQLVVPVESSDEAIVFLLQSLNFGSDTMQEPREAFVQPRALSEAGASPHLQKQMADSFIGTWLRVDGSCKLAQTHRVSRPGDVFGDIIFNLLVAKIDIAIDTALAIRGLITLLPFDGTRAFEGVVDEHELGCVEMPKVSFVDDLALPVLSSTTAAHLSRTASTATVVIDTLAAHGMRCNLKKGKTEVVICFHGPVSRSHETQLWAQRTPCLQMESKTGGCTSILATRYYKHLGGQIHSKASMGLEVSVRCAQSAGANLRMRKFFGRGPCSASRIAPRRSIVGALSLSLLRYNCCTWSKLNAKQISQLAAAYSQVVRTILGQVSSSSKKHCESERIHMVAGMPDANIMLSAERLKYAHRALTWEPDPLIALIRLGCGVSGAWVDQVHRDFAMMQRHSGFYSLRKDKCSYAALTSALQGHSRQAWKLKIKRAVCSSVFVRDQAVTARLRLRDEAEGLIIGTDDPSEMPFACSSCKYTCKTWQGMRSHMARKHQLLHASVLLAGTNSTDCAG